MYLLSLRVGLIRDVRNWSAEIADAPGISGSKLPAFVRVLRWKTAPLLGFVRARVDVGPAKFYCYPGSTEASGLIYVGFLEWNETAFVARYLRPGDLFLDIGANIGPFSVVAATFVPGVEVVSVEPGETARRRLIENLTLNDLSTDAVVDKAIGESAGTVRFTTGLDTMNAVATDEAREFVEVEQITIDDLAGSREVALMKIDVEGLELSAFKGAAEQLATRPGPTILFELNGFCRRYEVEPEEVCGHLVEAGYQLFEYDGVANELVAFAGSGIPASNNLIATTDPDAVLARLRSSNVQVDLTDLPISMDLERRSAGIGQ